MQANQPGLLDMLRAELKFLEAGGYGQGLHHDWRPHFVFEDSPTCMNYRVAVQDRVPCTNCLLLALTPDHRRTSRAPCRHIPLNTSGETLDTLYRSADQWEIESVVGHWLRSEIARLEKQESEIAGMPGTSSMKEAAKTCAQVADQPAAHKAGA